MPSSFHVFQDDALGTSDAVDLTQRLRRREVSLSEVAQAAIERAKKADEALHTYAHTQFEQALNTSHHETLVDTPFSGVPTFIKDNQIAKGFETGFGSAAVTPKIETKDDPFIRQFRALGFNVLGKSVLPEFGFNATTEPAHDRPTLNPWNLGFSSGASSGGASALVASGAVPIAHGNDGGGSIRIPAACCGLVGLKPSRGRHIKPAPARVLPIDLISEGVLTRTVRDTAYYYHASEGIYQNKKLRPIAHLLNAGKRRLRVGLILESATGDTVHPEVVLATERCASVLSGLGHHVEPTQFALDESFISDFPLYWAMLAFLTSKTGRFTCGKHFDAAKMDGLSKGLIKHYRSQIMKTPLALFRLKQNAHRFLTSFERYDVLLSPVLTQPPLPIGELSPNVPFGLLFERLRAYVGFTPPANIAGSPAISLPGGMSNNHTPIGVQLFANLGREDTLLELAYELEGAMPWKHLYQQ